MININLLHVLISGYHPVGVFQIQGLYPFDLKDSLSIEAPCRNIILSAFVGCRMNYKNMHSMNNIV
jgi:hypothetical protein